MLGTVTRDCEARHSDDDKYLAELLVIAHSKLDVSWDNSGLLVVPGSIAC